MDRVQREKMMRGEREKAIIRDLKEANGTLSIECLIKRHGRSSVYSVLKRLKERGEGRFFKVEQSGKSVSTFQLIEKKAPCEEVKMLIQLLSGTNPLEVRKAAAEDFEALAPKYDIIPEEGVDFLVDNWYQPRYAEVQRYLLSALLRIAKTAKAKSFYEVVDKMKRTVDKVLEVAKDSRALPGLRQDAWGLLILLEEPRITDMAFELLTREEEQEGVISFVRQEVKRYAEENPLDAKKRLYNILLRLKEGTPAHQRILYLLQEIRYPNDSMRVPKIARYTITEPKSKSSDLRHNGEEH